MCPARPAGHWRASTGSKLRAAAISPPSGINRRRLSLGAGRCSPRVSRLGFFKAQAATGGDTAQGVFTAGPQVLEGAQMTVDQHVQGGVQLRQTVPPYGERVEYGMRELPAVEDANRTFIDQLRCKRWVADRGIDLSRLP